MPQPRRGETPYGNRRFENHLRSLINTGMREAFEPDEWDEILIDADDGLVDDHDDLDGYDYLG